MIYEKKEQARCELGGKRSKLEVSQVGKGASKKVSKGERKERGKRDGEERRDSSTHS
jgi:hypothetical protein